MYKILWLGTCPFPVLEQTYFRNCHPSRSLHYSTLHFDGYTFMQLGTICISTALFFHRAHLMRGTKRRANSRSSQGGCLFLSIRYFIKSFSKAVCSEVVFACIPRALFCGGPVSNTV